MIIEGLSNNKLQELKAMHSSFLATWPIERVRQMKLEEYTGGPDAFCYALEYGIARDLGGIGGGYPTNFGIYRHNKQIESSKVKCDNEYTWVNRLGNNREEVWGRVHRSVLQIIEAAQQVDLDKISEIAFVSKIVKWKIAFLYQEASNAVICPVYKKEALQQAAVKLISREDLAKADYPDLYKALAAEFPDEDMHTLGHRVFLASVTEGDFSKNIRQEHVVAAGRKYAQEGIPEKRGKASKYCVQVEGEFYSPKVIYQLALEEATGVRFTDFKAGDNQPSFKTLNRLGFEVKAISSKEREGRSLRIFKVNHRAIDFEMFKQLMAERRIKLHQEGKGARLFQDEMTVDDYFYVCGHGVPFLGKVTSDVSYEDNGWMSREFALIRQSETPDLKYDGAKKGWSPEFRNTCARVPDNELELFEEGVLLPYFNMRLSELGVQTKGSEMKTSMAIEEPPTNRIYYGPPGTGKTYRIQHELMDEYVDRQATVTKDEFCEQLVESFSWWQVIAAALYDMGASKVADIKQHDLITAKLRLSSTNSFTQTIWNQLQAHTHPDETNVKRSLEARKQPYIFKKNEEIQWVPEVAVIKEECPEVVEAVESLQQWQPEKTTKRRYVFITFHQSYSYEEFVEGIRPEMNDDEDSSAGRTLSYKIQKGIFSRICDTAKNDPANRYAIFIDEINRGNISKIFGELITLIEPDKRQGQSNELAVKLPYSGDIFSVPSNLDIYGTMNTADRSLAQLDIALRRRFEFESVLPDSDVLSEISVDGVDIRRMFQVINQRIELIYDRDHTLGHSYFLPLEDDPSIDRLAGIMKDNVLPLLEEYFFEDWHKIRMVLGDAAKEAKRKALCFLLPKYREADIDSLLGPESGFENNAYSLNEDALYDPDAYVGIYDSSVFE